MDIIIENLQTKIPLNTAQARKIIRKIINEERLLVTQLSCNFVSRQKIKQLKKEYSEQLNERVDAASYSLRQLANHKTYSSDPKTAAMTVLKSLADVPQPITKKPRSDKGKQRKKPEEAEPNA